MKAKLIRTSTVSMSREDWLLFRQPIHHVLTLLESYIGVDYVPGVKIARNNRFYKAALKFFETEVWNNFIFPCIGASEVGTVMGLNKYQSAVEIYYEKVGIKSPYQEENRFMFWGKELEEKIAQVWESWDGSMETTIDNFRKGIKVRRCKKVNAYLQNPDFKWLFVSLDREMNKDLKSNKNGALELKTISGYAANQWESGIPPQYVAQLQTQCGVGEYDFGELGILKDGRDFEVLPFDYNEPIITKIIEKTKVFYETVKLGVKEVILSMLCESEETSIIHLHEADKLCPDPDGSVSYETYLKENFQDKGGELDGGLDQFYDAIMFELCKFEMEKAELQQRLYGNKLKAFLGERSGIIMKEGTVTWKANKNGVRSLRVRVTYTDKDIELAKNRKVVETGADIIGEVPEGYLVPGVTADVPED